MTQEAEGTNPLTALWDAATLRAHLGQVDRECVHCHNTGVASGIASDGQRIEVPCPHLDAPPLCMRGPMCQGCGGYLRRVINDDGLSYCPNDGCEAFGRTVEMPSVGTPVLADSTPLPSDPGVPRLTGTLNHWHQRGDRTFHGDLLECPLCNETMTRVPQ